MSDSLDTSEGEALPWVKPSQPAPGDEDTPAMTKEERALGAFLAAMYDSNLDGAAMRKAMLNALGLSQPPAHEQASVERIRLIDGEWPIIELGFGKVEVAEGWQGDTPALIFGRNGLGEIGAPTQPNRLHLPGETLAVVTFANAESLDVVAGKLAKIRAEHFPAATTTAEPAVKPITVPSGIKIERNFRWDSDALHHVPQLLIEFDPVPMNSPNDAKGWTDRDALAAALSASPAAPEADLPECKHNAHGWETAPEAAKPGPTPESIAEFKEALENLPIPRGGLRYSAASDIKSLLQSMIVSSCQLVDADGNVTGYQIKTGALHTLIGQLGLHIPNGLPTISAKPEQQAEFCSCHPKQCQGEGLARCRWAVMGFDPQVAQVAQPLTDERKDYLRRLVAGVRRMIDQDPETIQAREECGDECITGTWIDASLLCLVVEKDVLHMPAYGIGKDQAS